MEDNSRYFNLTDGTKIQVGTFFCIGKNYADHAAEMGGEVPKDPVVFLKPPAAYVPDGGKIRLPDFSENIHHELELVVVIGKDCNSISRDEAADHIAGFGVGIDVTLRDIQATAKKKGHPWAISKGFYTSAPVSDIIPFEKIGIPDYSFELNLEINGIPRQKGITSNMERQVSILIEYLSKVFTLRRGDCIFTGTPEGVGRIIKGDMITAGLKGFISLNVKAV